jgi:hypothetical protein
LLAGFAWGVGFYEDEVDVDEIKNGDHC